MNQQLLTALVVFLGLAALAAAVKLGAPSEAIAAGVVVLVGLAGSLRSMLLTEKKKP